jgi:ferredoxin-NADP reductase
MASIAERFGSRIRVFVYTARRGSLLPYADDLRHRMRENGATTIIQDRRLTTRQMNSVLVRRAIYLVAGPAGMQRAWIGFLHDNQVAADRIYCEPFAW